MERLVLGGLTAGDTVLAFLLAGAEAAALQVIYTHKAQHTSYLLDTLHLALLPLAAGENIARRQ